MDGSYQEQKTGMLREENRRLKNKREKAYKFMKQLAIGEINLLEKLMKWLGEKVIDVRTGKL